MEIQIEIKLSNIIYKIPVAFKYIHDLITQQLKVYKVKECYGVWYHGLTPSNKEPSELLAIFEDYSIAEQYVENVKKYRNGYCLIVKANYYK